MCLTSALLSYAFARKYCVCVQKTTVVPHNKIIPVSCMLWWYQTSFVHQALDLTPMLPIEMVTLTIPELDEPALTSRLSRLACSVEACRQTANTDLCLHKQNNCMRNYKVTT